MLSSVMMLLVSVCLITANVYLETHSHKHTYCLLLRNPEQHTHTHIHVHSFTRTHICTHAHMHIRPACPSVFAHISTEIGWQYRSMPVFLKIQIQSFQKAWVGDCRNFTEFP